MLVDLDLGHPDLGTRFGTPPFGTLIWDPNVISKMKQNSSDMNVIILASYNVISKIKQNSSDMNEIILASYDVISKIKQNSSDMNEIILASCDAGLKLLTSLYIICG
jgi:hypothetical protein